MGGMTPPVAVVPLAVTSAAMEPARNGRDDPGGADDDGDE